MFAVNKWVLRWEFVRQVALSVKEVQRMFHLVGPRYYTKDLPLDSTSVRLYSDHNFSLMHDTF